MELRSLTPVLCGRYQRRLDRPIRRRQRSLARSKRVPVAVTRAMHGNLARQCGSRRATQMVRPLRQWTRQWTRRVIGKRIRRCTPGASIPPEVAAPRSPARRWPPPIDRVGPPTGKPSGFRQGYTPHARWVCYSPAQWRSDVASESMNTLEPRRRTTSS